MNFGYKAETIRKIIGINENQFIIPRYQRDYSWSKKETEQFLKDILENIKINEAGRLDTQKYFFGTIILQGDIDDSQKILEVIDGQQRISTIIILLSVIFNICRKNEDVELKNLGEKIYRDFLMIDINGQRKKSLILETTNDFFSKYIYDHPDYYQLNGTDRETELIKSSYIFFENSISCDNIIDTYKKYSNLDVSTFSYFELLNSIFNQLVSSVTILISTPDNYSSNKLFESLNSKGLKLSEIDLIKNKIFGSLTEQEPVDKAKNSWKTIKNNLSPESINYIKIDDFYYHYWIANKPKTTKSNLYSLFLKKVKEKDYLIFLEELEKYSKIYSEILGSKNYDCFEYSCREEIKYLLKTIFSSFSIRQAIIPIIQLVRCYDERIIKAKSLKDHLRTIADFHCIYNSICAQKTNVLEKKYNKIANGIRQIIDSTDTKEIKANNIKKSMDEFYKEISKLIPDKKIYDQMFNLTYTNIEENSDNDTAKYVLYRTTYEANRDFNAIYTVEHLFGENIDRTGKNVFVRNIGNLVMIEKTLNERAGDKDIVLKGQYYKRSINEILIRFINSHETISYESFCNCINDAERNEIIKLRSEEIRDDFWDLKNREFFIEPDPEAENINMQTI